MGCRYILLLEGRTAGSRDDFTEAPERLRGIGLKKRHACTGATLFASQDTPTLRIPGGGIIIGHVFLRDGTPLREESDFITSLVPGSAGSSLIGQCWGEYLLVQPAVDDASPLCMTRDPSGGVPCIHSFSDGCGFATSDISIATRLNLYERRIDWNFIAHFLAYTYVKSERTGLSRIRELLPGCTLRLHGTEPAVEQAWSPWDFVASARRRTSIDSAAAELRTVVRRTVGSWASVDGTALVELSGGLDSSIVATCLQGTSARVHCATLVPTLPGADERLYAEAVAHGLGTDLHVEVLDVDSARFDDPVPPWSVIPGIGPLQHAVDRIMDAVAAREGLHCFYSGGGGDTVFSFLGGAAPAADAFRERGFGAAVRTIRQLSDLHQCTFWLASRLTLLQLMKPHQPDRANGELLNASTVPDSPDSHPWSRGPDNALPGDRERISGLAGTQLFRDAVPRGMKRWFRLPLLSQPVMETCLSIPSWMWVAEGKNRSVARLAFSDALPPHVLHRRSKGSFSQYNAAFYRRNKAAMRRFLLGGQLQAHDLLDTEALSDFFDRPLSPRDRSFMRIVDLCRVENWVRHQS
jgi:asparagine synthase (glutamine-hydrolysing)